jgi:hypothetical protein
MQAALRLAALALSALALWGCEDVAYVVLTVEDPDGLATSAASLRIVEADAAESEYPLDGSAFPITQTLASFPGDVREVWVEAAASDGTTLGRDHVTLGFASERVGAATATLQSPCEDDAACDDGVFGNGSETCEDRVCVGGTAPCVAAVACVDVEPDEENQRCVTTLQHDRCEPIETEGGDLLDTYCDAAAGCLPGDACTNEGEDCLATDLCAPIRVCTSGRCVPNREVGLARGRQRLHHDRRRRRAVHHGRVRRLHLRRRLRARRRGLR